VAPAVQLLLGPENGQKDEFLDTLRKNIQKKTGEPPEEHRFYPFKLECADLVATLRNNALFSKHRLVILSDAHEIKTKADIDILNGYLKQPVEDATFVLMSDGYRIDRRLSGTIGKTNTRIFWELFENRKQAWIIDYFRKAGFSVDPEAVTLILELVENDTRDLRRECEHLTLFLKEGDTVTAERVEELIYHSRSESVFSLFERMVGGDFQGSLEVLQSLRLAGDGDPGQILGGLTWQFRRLLTMRRYVDRRHSYEDSLRKAEIKGKKNGRTYTDACRRFTAENLERILALISEYEADFRSGLAELQDIGLELFLYNAVFAKTPAPR
jgi:DNA polymerase-3 subunit delta